MTIQETGAWREAPDEWVCPCCRRVKAACEVPKGDGTTLRWLVEHHDHMADFVKHVVKRQNGGWHGYCADHPLRIEAMQFLYRIQSLAKRFENILVCLDCNEVEGKIKNRVKADKFFSFDMQEIQRAFVPTPNQRHFFVEEHMPFYSALYSRVKERLVDERKRIIEGLVGDAHGKGCFWGAPFPSSLVCSADDLLLQYPRFGIGSLVREGIAAGLPVLRDEPWTASQDEQLRHLHGEGLSSSQIAATVGRTQRGIEFRLVKFGLLRA